MGITIARFWKKIKTVLTGELFVVILLILVGFLSFGLGRLSVKEASRPPVRILNAPNVAPVQAGSPPPTNTTAAAGNASVQEATGAGEGAYVASVNGTRYYLPTCGTVNRIKEENKVWFKTKADAEAAGYTPAANCPGL